MVLKIKFIGVWFPKHAFKKKQAVDPNYGFVDKLQH